LDGGAGEDTVGFAGRAVDFTITLSADGRRAWVRDLNLADGDEGTDALLGIERLQFADRMIRPEPPPTLGGPRAVFTADDGATGRELWVTDGTAAGTRIVADLEPGRGGSDAYNFAAFGEGRVVFSAATAATGREAWVTDGTAAGTRLLQDIGPGGSGSDPWGFAPLQDGRMLFAAAGPAGREP
jgi:ELWxxDGT repeat protein